MILTQQQANYYAKVIRVNQHLSDTISFSIVHEQYGGFVYITVFGQNKGIVINYGQEQEQYSSVKAFEQAYGFGKVPKLILQPEQFDKIAKLTDCFRSHRDSDKLTWQSQSTRDGTFVIAHITDKVLIQSCVDWHFVASEKYETINDFIYMYTSNT